MPDEVMRIDITPPDNNPVATASAAQLAGGVDMSKSVEQGLKNAGFTGGFFTKLAAIAVAGRALRSSQKTYLEKRDRRIARQFGPRYDSPLEENIASQFGLNDTANAERRRGRVSRVDRIRGRRGAMMARRLGKTRAGRGVAAVGRGFGIGTGRTAMATAGSGIATAILAGAAAFAAVGETLSRTLGDLSGSISGARARTSVQAIRTRMTAARSLGPLATTWEEIKQILLKILDPILKILGPGIQLIATLLRPLLWVVEKIADILGVVGSIFESVGDGIGFALGGFGLFDGEAKPANAWLDTPGATGQSAVNVSSNQAVQVIDATPAGMTSLFRDMEESNESIARGRIQQMKLSVIEFVRKIDIARAEKITHYESKLVIA